MAEQRFTPREAETDTVYPEAAQGEPVADPPGRPSYKDETERLGREEPNMERDRSMPRVSFGPESDDSPSPGPSDKLPGERRAVGDPTGLTE